MIGDASRPRILFLVPDIVNPSGGVWVIYRHVGILRQHGIDAEVVHQQAGFRYPWDDSGLPVTSIDDVVPRSGDLVVLPDVAVAAIREFDPDQPVAVFSQNAYLTPWERPPARHRPDNPYRSPNLVGVVTTNVDNLRVLARAFPHVDVRRLFLSVSSDMHFDEGRKEPLVSYMPRKNPADAARVIELLGERDAFVDLEVQPIQGCTLRETADILARSSVFLSFGHPEGWALPPAEAMASGCVIVGYHGRGGREYWAPGCTHPIDHGDIDRFVDTADVVLRRLREHPEAVLEAGRRAASFIRSEYPVDREVASVIDTWMWCLSRAESFRASVAGG